MVSSCRIQEIRQSSFILSCFFCPPLQHRWAETFPILQTLVPLCFMILPLIPRSSCILLLVVRRTLIALSLFCLEISSVQYLILSRVSSTFYKAVGHSLAKFSATFIARTAFPWSLGRSTSCGRCFATPPCVARVMAAGCLILISNKTVSTYTWCPVLSAQQPWVVGDY